MNKTSSLLESPSSWKAKLFLDPYRLVFILLFIIFFGCTNKWLTMSTGETTRMAAIESMVRFRTQAIDKSRFLHLTNDFIVRNGVHYSDKPPVYAFIGACVYAPFYYIFGLTYAPRGEFTHYLLKWFLTGFPLLMFALFLYSDYKTQLKEPVQAFLFTALAIFGSLLMPYATVLNNHTTAASFYGVALFLIWKRKKNYFWGGFCFALASCIDLSCFLMSLPFGIWMLFQKISWRDWKFFWFGVSLPLLLHAALNIPITGDLKPGAMHPEFFSWMTPAQQQELTGGIAWSNFKDYSIYLFHMLIGKRGFFLHCPIAFFALWACAKTALNRSLEKSERTVALSFIASMCLVILYYSACSNKFGHFCYSIRWFLVFLPAFLFYLPKFYQKKRFPFVLFTLFWITLVTLPAFYNPYLNYPKGCSFFDASIRSLKMLETNVPKPPN